MGIRERKARAAGETVRARENINNESIAPHDREGTGKEWHNMMYRHEVQALVDAGVSKSGIAVYEALTHWEKTPGRIYCVPATKLAADTHLSLDVVYKALAELQRKHIIKCVRKGTRGRKGEPGRSASYISLIIYDPNDDSAESPAVGGKRTPESPAVGGKRFIKYKGLYDESPAVGGKRTPESPAVGGKLKEI